MTFSDFKKLTGGPHGTEVALGLGELYTQLLRFQIIGRRIMFLPNVAELIDCSTLLRVSGQWNKLNSLIEPIQYWLVAKLVLQIT